ncbi:von Willebrand factor A domain-containing protein 8 [Prorops nasuta]|uniref:von Willebrand factor A domain-containing protein 8 n=1 Tax=Prorops nasuta TaxID=863751 RepID=UPI0034CF8F14
MLFLIPQQIYKFGRILTYSKKLDIPFIRYRSDETVVAIADVSKIVKSARNVEYVPRKYLINPSQEIMKHLKWMLQKDILGQDIFLMGAPGTRKRHIAMSYVELIGKEVEFITLSRDTTEADLKQRREIKSGTAFYHDQSAVRAAKYGRILIIEGVEKAERNVLPVLNNLLENREMHLEDGCFLISASRYDKLLESHSKDELNGWRLIRVNDDFRVIALGLPSPRYPGHPLDPPLRSRFQAQHIPPPMFTEQLEDLTKLAPNVNPNDLSRLLSCAHALRSKEASSLGLPDFPLDNLNSAAILLDKLPSLSTFDVFYRFYPYKTFLAQEGRNAVEHILETFGVECEAEDKARGNCKIENGLNTENSMNLTIDRNQEKSAITVPCGSKRFNKEAGQDAYIETDYQNNLIADIMESHLVSDLCIVGPRGCGKSKSVQKFAELLKYQLEPIVLYQDMTSRDLLQQRTTLNNGDTVWKDSPLVTAAIEGKLAVLDGIHRVHSSTIALLHRLVHDRELQLHDGKRLLRSDRYEEIKQELKKTDEELRSSGVLKIHPSFRIIALAEKPNVGSSTGQWLNSELLSLFLFHEMRPLSKDEEIHIIRSKYGEPNEALTKIIDLTHKLRSSQEPTLQSLAESLSTRQLLRIAKRMQTFHTQDAYDAVQRACLVRFLPHLAKQVLDDSLTKLNILPLNESKNSDIKCQVTNDTVKIGETSVNRYKTTSLSKVPDILFYDVPQHLKLLETLLQDFSLGQHLLLIGNQGVGKNKIIDRLLQLMRRPREYIQLHRDTTVQTLTLQPMVRDGIVVYEDSPLVQAVKSGHVLVIDEADKAPTHVTCILKTLVESGEMILSDGRRIVPFTESGDSKIDESKIQMHPDFRMIVLANRPGFPFLGNDFFGALGDLFSTHSVDNPSVENEIQLLKQYGPNVDKKIIEKLVKAFGELRRMADQGIVSYPYSTREVVNIVKHLQEFPNEPLGNVVRNVFDFDRYSEEVYNTLINVLHKHGIPIGTSSSNVILAKELSLPPRKLISNWNISNWQQQLSIQGRYIKFQAPTNLIHNFLSLDCVETRSVWFTELQNYWTIPLDTNSIIAGMSLSKGLKGDGSNDRIAVLTVNPVALYTMTLESDKIQKISFQDLPIMQRNKRPQFKIAPDKEGNIYLHEESGNILLKVNLEDTSAAHVLMSSFIDLATNRIAKVFDNNIYWKMNEDLLPSHNQIILFSPNYDKIENLHLDSLNAYTIQLPFKINSVLVASDQRWLILDTKKEKYILEKSVSSLPCPDILRKVEESSSDSQRIVPFISCNQNSLDKTMLSAALGQKIDAPNRVLAANDLYAAIAVGFPELNTENELYVWQRDKPIRKSISPCLNEDGQIIRVLSAEEIPANVFNEDEKNAGISNYLEVVDTSKLSVRYIPVPMSSKVSHLNQWLFDNDYPFYAAMTSNQGVVTVDVNGCIRLWETSLMNVGKSLDKWRRMVGHGEEKLQITKERYSGLDVSEPKHGKVDEKNEPHVGGNTWAGGTGGRDTAGLGGKGGPYRLDAGHTVHQLSDEEKAAVPEHVKKAAREMGLRAFKQRLKDIKMSEYDHKVYSQYSDPVQKQVQSLRIIIDSLQVKTSERQWCRNQTSGELDDTKLIEGLTGEKTIYRRRMEKEPEIGAPQTKPKRLKLVVDVSASMYRFNGYDQRLDREMEACVMVMEALSGHERKIQYDIVGHSGDDYNIIFTESTCPVNNNKGRLEIIKMMHAHSQYCMPGDNTLEATQHAIKSLEKEDSDESIVVVLSDANLERYAISPSEFAKALSSSRNINAYAIFIGSLNDQATRLTSQLPLGKAFVCLNLENIPHILQQIFTLSILNTSRQS